MPASGPDGCYTIPANDGHFGRTGAVFTTYVDDDAEVWINGQMPWRSGYPSPATIRGLNMPNRVALAEAVKPATNDPGAEVVDQLRCRRIAVLRTQRYLAATIPRRRGVA